MTPKRLQRKRTKGWKKPPNSVIVDRTSKWGNPFKLVGNAIYVNAKHRRKGMDPWVYVTTVDPGTYNMAVFFYETLIKLISEPELDWKFYDFELDYMYWLDHFNQLDFSELRGKDLICFCKEGEDCHADVLIELANK